MELNEMTKFKKKKKKKKNLNDWIENRSKLGGVISNLSFFLNEMRTILFSLKTKNVHTIEFHSFITLEMLGSTFKKNNVRRHQWVNGQLFLVKKKKKIKSF